MATFDNDIRSPNTSTIIVSVSVYWPVPHICTLLDSTFMAHFFYYYKPFITVILAPCPPAAVCTQLNVTTAFEMDFYGSDGTHQGKLKQGLTPDDYIAKANELIAPELRKSYAGIMDKVDEEVECQQLRNGSTQSVHFTIVTPRNLEDIVRNKF